MTVSPSELGFYVIGLFILFLTPGPVLVALIARTLGGGFKQAWPLALGVAIGDIFWSVAAVLGMGWIASSFDGAMLALRLVATLFFLWMGFTLIRSSGSKITTNGKLNQPGVVAGLLAGLVVIMANPKAILFYMGVLPGFFDLSALTWPDIIAIAIASFFVPLTGNLFIAFFVGRARELLSSESSVRRINLIAGSLLITVGLIIPFT